MKIVKTNRNLVAPLSYLKATQSELEDIVNGCGPSGWKERLVPDTIYGLNVNPACAIHDYCYHIGITEEDKKEADTLFLNNMRQLIDNADSWWWLRKLRYIRANTYYKAVDKFGGSAFNNKS